MAEGSDSRTEAATPRRVQRARAAGQVPLSREAAPAAMLAAAALVLAMHAPGSATRLAVAMRTVMAQAAVLSPGAAIAVLTRPAIGAVLPFALAAALAASAAVLGQTGLLIRPAALAPSLGRLNIARNAARLVGPRALQELGRALLKLAVLGGALVLALHGLPASLARALSWPVQALPDHVLRLLLGVLLAAVAAQGALALLDVGRARWAHGRSLRMSREELREEHREADGDPRIKARIRRLRIARARRRMLEAVRKATVVVTNPTHYAVALAYERGSSGAPRVVAKGVDAMAARIREAAEAARVPLVTNPPLARTLWLVELECEVPAALFQAVAEIIAYVWRLRTPRRGP